MKEGTFYGATAAKRAGIMQLKLPHQIDMYQVMQSLLSSSVQIVQKHLKLANRMGFCATISNTMETDYQKTAQNSNAFYAFQLETQPIFHLQVQKKIA